MAGIEFDITGDNNNLLNSVRQAEAGVVDAINSIEKSGKQMDSVFDNLGEKVAGAFAVSSLVAFQKKIIDVRGEMESLQKSFQSLVGEHLGKKLYEDIKQFATTTPMMMNDLAKGAQTLLGFNIEAEKVMPILRQIGDISMGDAQKFNSLTLAFAQMSSTGKLMGQDLLQMINAGFNPLVVMSEKTGKSVAQLKDEMSKGAITVEMVEEAFRAATSEGGKFNGMLLSQSKTLNGAISNMQGAYQDMLNSIGEAEQGVLMTGVNITTKLLQNYETIGKVLLQLVATYGSYKAAVIAVSVAEDFLNGKYIIKTRLLRAAALAQELLNNAMLKNPAVLVATAVLSFVSALVIFRNRTDEAAEAHERLNEAFGETQAKIASEEKKLDDLFGKLQKSVKGTQEYKDAKKAIVDQYGQYFNGLDNEIEKVGGVENAYRKLTQAVRESLMARGKENAMKEATEAYNKNYGEFLSKIYNQVREQSGEENAKNAVRAIRADLKLTGEVAEDTQRAIKRVADGVNYAWFGKLNEAESTFKKSQQEVNVLFGEQEKNIDNSAQKAKNLGEAYKEAQKSFNEADAMVKKMEKNRSAYSDEQWNEWSEKLKKRKEEFEKLGGDPDGKKAKSDAKAFNEQASRNAKSIEQQQQYEELLARMEQEAANARATANIEAIKNNGDRERAERRAEYERQKRDILQQEADIYKTIYEQRKEAYENANKDKKYANTAEGKLGYGKDKNGKFVMAGTLDTDELKLYKAAYSKMMADLDALNAKHNRSETEYQRERLQAMLDYLSEYGTIQQKKYSIAKEYAEKIREAEGAGEAWKYEVKRLKAEEQARYAAVDTEALEQKIDWKAVLGGMTDMLGTEMRQLLSDLTKYTESADFAKRGADEQKTIYDAIEKLRLSVGEGQGTLNFGNIKEQMEKLGDSVTKLSAAQLSEKQAWEQVSKAQKEYDEALKSGTEDQKKEAKIKLDMATTNAEAQSDIVKVQATATKNLSQSLKASEQDTVEGLDMVASGLNDLANGSLAGAFTGFQNIVSGLDKLNIGGAVGEAIGSLSKTLGSAGFIGQLISAILSILDALKDGIGPIIAGLIDTLFNAITGIIENIITGDFAVQIVNALVKGITNLLDTLTFGGFSSWLSLDNDNHEEMLELQERYTKSIEATTKALDRMSEQLEKSYGGSALDISKEAKELISKNLSTIIKGIDSVLTDRYGGGEMDYTKFNRAQDILERIQSYGSRYGVNAWEQSEGHYTWQQILRNDVNSVAQMFKDIRDSGDDLWYTITQQMGYNEGALEDWLEKLIETYDTFAETDKKLKEQLTTTTAENVFDNFLGSLYDIADGVSDVTDDIAKDWQKMVNRMVVNNLVADGMRKQLDDWYDRLALLNEQRQSGMADNIYNDALDQLGEDYDKIISAGQQKIEELRSAGIITDVTKEYFSNLRDAWLNMLTGMEDDTKAFRESIQKTMLNDLVSTFVLGDSFKIWLDDWKERYGEVLEDEKNQLITQEERDRRLNALLDEQMKKREELTKKTEEFADAVGLSNKKMFTDLRSNFVSALTNMETDVEEWIENIRTMMVQQLIEKTIVDGLLGDTISLYEERINNLFKGLLDGTYSDNYVNKRLNDIADNMEQDLSKAKEQTKKLWEAFGLGASGAEKQFGNLRDLMLKTLSDTEATAESLRESLEKTLTENLIGSVIDNYTVDGQLFGKWVKKWSEEYTQVFEDLSNPDREEDLEWYIDRLVEVYGDLEGKVDELRERLKALKKDTSFKNMTDSFISSLMDANATAEDWAKNIGKTMAQRIVEQMVAATMIQPLLDRLQDAINTEMGAEGAVWEDVFRSEEVKAALDAISAAYPQLKEVVKGITGAVEEALGVSLSDLPLSDLQSSLISSLTSMEDDAAAFGKRIGSTLMEQMIEQFVSQTYGDRIREIQQYWQKFLAGEEGYTLEEVQRMIGKLRYDMTRDKDLLDLTDDYKKLNNDADTMFKGMGDSWTSLLMDMNGSAEDFGSQIGQTLVSNLVKELLVGKVLQGYLDDIQTAFELAQERYADISDPAERILAIAEDVTPAIDAAVAATEEWKPAVDAIAQRFETIDNSTPLDGLRSSFLSSLMDMESKTEDFAANINNILTEAFVDKFVLGEGFDKKLAEWQKEYRDIMGNDTLSDAQRAAALRNLQNAMTEQRDAWSKQASEIQNFMAYGKIGDQQVTANMADKATYDQFETYLGLAYAHQIALEQGNTVRQQILATLQTLTGITVPDNSALLAQMAIANGNLQLIQNYTRVIRDEVRSNLGSINSRLSTLNNRL